MEGTSMRLLSLALIVAPQAAAEYVSLTGFAATLATLRRQLLDYVSRNPNETVIVAAILLGCAILWLRFSVRG
jgi:hypothetical protein